MNRQKIYEKFGCKCAYCGEDLEFKKMQVDHVISKANFFVTIMNHPRISVKIVPPFLEHLTINDVNHIDNLFPTCRYCNKHKDTFTLEGFRGEISKQVERCNLYSRNYRVAKRYGLITENIKPIKFWFENFIT